MAQSGDDIRLSRMLLDVAIDLDAEAEAIEAENLTKSRRPARIVMPDAMLTVVGAG
jgi:hypothetical protein